MDPVAKITYMIIVASSMREWLTLACIYVIRNTTYATHLLVIYEYVTSWSPCKLSDSVEKHFGLCPCVGLLAPFCRALGFDA